MTIGKDGYDVEQRAWRKMLRRCYVEHDLAYPSYGGRGIKVCERWRESFSNFLEDMGRKPSPDLSIDRIDNDGDYAPDNCRWADRKTQMSNRRCSYRVVESEHETGDWRRYYDIDRIHYRIASTIVSVGGVTRTIEEWSALSGLSTSTLLGRVPVDGGEPPADWLLDQRGGSRTGKRTITIGDETLDLDQWAARAGVSRQTIAARQRRGITGEALLVGRVRGDHLRQLPRDGK